MCTWKRLFSVANCWHLSANLFVVVIAREPTTAAEIKLLASVHVLHANLSRKGDRDGNVGWSDFAAISGIAVCSEALLRQASKTSCCRYCRAPLAPYKSRRCFPQTPDTKKEMITGKREIN